ncbi:hypothetical protein PTSG_03528 [Salpingoeca rosetta]|uniref:Uncharacterized protein n=1 Tax=Salpingoeca rosetta (strain ATCC 50818 / BSB-021) TaxID=946362 RepID=F2U5V6_SALR5|nr:uncharacterized protein PTSG_03528 [Salpingoeca rosetta]EGD82897.1 hypothetical protein PTSG_03528 [Salpingoeca rosetta]|eukprot:XP_004995261.1 hypothetical protein PTSG_03528 [Salpingoeca rosetta]
MVQGPKGKRGGPGKKKRALKGPEMSEEEVEREIEALEEEVRLLQHKLCQQAQESQQLRSKKQEHAVHRYIQGAAQHKMQHHFDRLDALATVMADVYNGKHRLLEVEKQRLLMDGYGAEGECQKELRKLVHSDKLDLTVVDALYERHSYRDISDALLSITEEIARDVESDGRPANTSRIDCRREDDAPPNLLTELEQLVHEEERKYVLSSLEIDSANQTAQQHEDQCQQHANAIELQLGDTRADDALREYVQAMGDAAAVEAERKALEVSISDATSVVNTRARQRDAAATKTKQLHSFEDDMRVLSSDLVRISRQVEQLRVHTHKQLDSLRRGELGDVEQRVETMQHHTDADAMQEEVQLVSRLPLSALTIAHDDSLPLRLGQTSIRADDTTVNGYWNPSFAHHLRTTLLAPHQSVDHLLTTLLHAQYRSARGEKLLRAAEQTHDDVRHALGGSHRHDTVQGVLERVAREDEVQRTGALPEVNGAMEWMSEARDDVALARHLLQQYTDQPAFGLA